MIAGSHTRRHRNAVAIALAGTLGLLLLAAPRVRAEFTGIGWEHNTLIVTMGEIEPHDAERIDAVMVLLEERTGHRNGLLMWLESPGGSLYGALELGRVLRKWEAAAMARSCSSSCVFLLAGAARRGVSGFVDIHRPYLRQDSADTPEEQRTQYGRIESDVRAYLQEMNVSTELLDLMMRIPSTDSHRLSEAELLRFGLSTNDPYVDQADLAREAKRFGVSTEEYIRRKTLADRFCEPDWPATDPVTEAEVAELKRRLTEADECRELFLTGGAP